MFARWRSDDRADIGFDGDVGSAVKIGEAAGPALSGCRCRLARRLERHVVPDPAQMQMFAGEGE